ncbi:hypothetical protein BOH78_5356 [Pichia kudriavzevii]|uniref:Uncharacterized protein n=1 Tax=Pichia kudriavzevii TaxID=4909 RepID=A0A099NTH5_PICKU|nr:hypothetical protein JL09_g5674 [Pichia kudriavzevii]ONH70277.1 hypothetical protein BOH78_5356 [Pichia kudriavzevii]
MLEFERRVSYYMKLGNSKKSFCKIKYKFPKYFENNIQRRAETLELKQLIMLILIVKRDNLNIGESKCEHHYEPNEAKQT